MKKLLVLGLLGLAGALPLAACGSDGDDGEASGGDGGGEDIEIAVVPKYVGIEFYEMARQGAECAGSEEGVTVLWDGVTGPTDVNGQVNLLQNFITRGVDGLSFAAIDAAALAPVVDEAKAADVAVVNFDAGVDPQPEDVAVFGTDNVAAAEQIPDVIAESVGDKPAKVAYIAIPPGSQTGDLRTKGFKEGLENYPNIELVSYQSGGNDFNESLRVAEDILTANKELDYIVAESEPSGVGAAEAVRKSGRKDVKVISWDSSPELLDGLKDGVIEALVVQDPFRMGYESVKGLVAQIRDGAAPQNTDTGVAFVTKDNQDDPDISQVLAPSCG